MPHDSSPASATPLAAPPAPTHTVPAGDLRALFRNRTFQVALAVYIVSRIYFGLFFKAGTTDIFVYFDYAVQAIDLGQVPYSTLSAPSPHYRNIQNLEYPPVGYWLTALPRRLPHETLPRGPENLNVDVTYDEDLGRYLTIAESRDYEFRRKYDQEYWIYADRFRVLMLLFDIGGFAFFCGILRRRRPDVLLWGMWGYTISTSLLHYLLFERFDIALTFALLAWSYCWLRAEEPNAKSWAWSAAAYTALGLGISLKLIPVLLVPFALLCDLYALARPPRRWSLLVGPVLLIVAALGPFAYYYAIVGGDLKGMFRYHSVRGIQIESSYATLMMLLKPAEELYCYFDFGSWNLGGTLEAPLLKASTWALLAALAGLGLRSFVAPALGEKYDRAASYRMACVVIPVATLLAKVFSPQYLLWALPMLLLAASELFSRRGFIATVVLVVFACVCSCFIFPYHYLDQMLVYPYTEERRPLWTLIAMTEGNRGALDTGLVRAVMIVRNLILGGLCAALYVMALLPTRSATPTLEGERGTSVPR
jgi:hypothetical protein